MGQTGSSPKISKYDQAIFKLKLQKDALIKYNKSLNLMINNDLNNAKQNIKNKHVAKLYLKKKKTHEELLGKVMTQIDSLDEMIMNIQFKLIEKDFVQSIQHGNNILKVLNIECSANKVSKVLDEAQDQIEIQKEIDDLIVQGNLSEVSDADIEEELQLMEKQQTQVKDRQHESVQQLPEVQDMPLFPDVAKGELQQPHSVPQKKEASSSSSQLVAN